MFKMSIIKTFVEVCLQDNPKKLQEWEVLEHIFLWQIPKTIIKAQPYRNVPLYCGCETGQHQNLYHIRSPWYITL